MIAPVNKLSILTRIWKTEEKIARINNDAIIKALEFKLEILKVLYGSY